MKHYRGNETVQHFLAKQQVVYILERMGRHVKTEFSVYGIKDDRYAVVDIADVTDWSRPVYYEIEKTRGSERFKRKAEYFRRVKGVDLVCIILDDMDRALGKNAGILEMQRWLKEQVI